MKKALAKVLAIIITVALMVTASIVMTAMAEDVAKDIAVFLPKGYGAEPVDSVFDEANELVTHTRIVDSYNWNGWSGNASSPMIKDAHGMQRKQANGSEHAYITFEVNNTREIFAVGMVIATQYVGVCDNFYYTSADGVNWKPINPIGYAEPALTVETTGYMGEVDLIGNMPEDTKYLRVATHNPKSNSWWAPLFDFVDVYDIDIADANRFAAAAAGYKVTTTIESLADFNASPLKLGEVSGLQSAGDSTRNYRTTNTAFITPSSNAKGSLAFKVSDKQVVETTTVFDEAPANIAAMSIEFFYTSDANAAEIVWAELPVTSIAKTPTLTVKSDGTTAMPGNYRAYTYRLFNLPEGTEGIKIVLGSKSWAPTIDYIDILDVDIAYAPRFEAVMNGYSAKATYNIESFTNFTASPIAFGAPVGLQGASDSTRNYRADKNFITPSANAKGNLAFMVDDTQVIETATVFDEGSSNIAAMSIEFFYTTDVNATELVWNALPETSLAKTPTLTVKADGTTAFTGNYRGYVYRIFNLPEGTEAVKIVLGAKTWAPTIDYIDIYDLDTDLTDADRFEAALKDTKAEPTTIESLAEFNASPLKLGDVSGLQSASDSTRNYRTTNTMFITPSANAKGSLAFKVNDSQIIETTTVFDEAASNIAAMSIEFFYTIDADAETVVWQPMPITSIAKTPTLTVKSDGTTAMPGNYRAYTYRLFNLPEGTEGIKIVLGSKTWAPTIDYIDIYNIDTLAAGRYEAAFGDAYTVADKVYFEDNTKINVEGYVVSYEGLTVHSAGLGVSEANYAKADTTEGGNVVINVTDTQLVRTGLVVHKGQKANTYLTYYVSKDNVNWTKLTNRHIATTEKIATTVAATPNTTDYYLVEERLTNLPAGTKYLKVEVTTPTAWQPGLDFIYVYDLAEAPHEHKFGEWLYNPIKHTVEKFCEDDYTYYIKGNVADTAEADGVLDIYDIVMMNEIAGGAEFNGEADVLDGDDSGVFDLADLTWLRKFILRKIYG